jgi:hypothetical protein
MLRTDPVLWERDERKMTSEWASQVVTVFRRDWIPAVEPGYYNKMKRYLLSKQDMQGVKDYFDDQEFLNKTKFKPLPILEKPRKIIIDKLRKSGIRPYVKAVDPASIQDKEQDRFRLSSRKANEATRNAERQKIGLNPVTTGYDEFNGNIEEFDQMMLSENEPSDIDFFFKTNYKLKYEIDAQNIIDSVIKLNRSEDNAARYAIDILCSNHTCQQTYISPQTGQIMALYVDPTEARIIWGDNRDSSDAPAKGWSKMVTVDQILKMLGNAFSFQLHWQQLLMAINSANGTSFDGFIRGGVPYLLSDGMGGISIATNHVEAERQYQYLDWGDCYRYKVSFGYIEWEQMIDHTEKYNPQSKQRFWVPNDWKAPERSPFQKEVYTSCKILCSYFLSTGATSQWLFGYGPLYHQLFEGQYDEYARGSMCIVREEGIPSAEIAEIYADLANYAYYKMIWAIRKSKPDRMSYSYESIVEVAKKMVQETQGTNTPQNAGAFQSAVEQLIERFEKKNIMIHTYPVKDGTIVGGGGVQHQLLEGRLDALAIQLREVVVEWAEFQILDKWGMAGVANATQPNPKEGLKLNQLFLSQSNSATGFIGEMYQKTNEHQAKMILLYCQDIIKHKDSIPYKALLKLVGKETLVSIEQLDKVAFYRLGIYITSLDTASKKEEVDNAAYVANERGEIQFHEWLLLKEIDDPRKAAMHLAYLKEKAAKVAQERAMELERMRQQTVQMQNEGQMQQIAAKGQFDLQSAQIAGEASVRGKELDYMSKVETKGMQINSDAPKQAERTEAEKEILNTKAELDQQASLAS